MFKLFLILVVINFAYAKGCPNGQVSFELMTGRVFTSPSDTMIMLPGTLQLTDCISYCQRNVTCKAINFETGLCIILSSSEISYPKALSPSQFPVYTIFAQKICIPEFTLEKCNRAWSFERVIGYELRNFEKKKEKADSIVDCMKLCLNESSFECRSANYNNLTGECSLSDMDRHTISNSGHSGILHAFRYFVPSSSDGIDYLENNCIQDPSKMCEFKPIKGKILKTVDTVHLDAKTVEDCKNICLNSPYRCFSFDFGDPSNSVCRTSHLDRASLTHIEDPYLNVQESTTYELSSCYNIKIICKAKEMVAHIKSSKLFNGKIYAKSKPNSCVNDVKSSLDFEISMPYSDLMCDVKQKSSGVFSNDIIVQHHDMIVTTQDLGLSVHCQYDLSNQSITNTVLEVDGDIQNREDGISNVHSVTVSAPKVTMKITNEKGFSIEAAQVGDLLYLKFEVIENEKSPYEIFVRDLVAIDGSDISEIILIDSMGCPTDANIMNSLSKSNEHEKSLQASFEAFKFPTSDIVQFRALVTPCLGRCEPVQCDIKDYDGMPKQALSYGRKKKRSVNNSILTAEEDMVVVQSIKIMDSFVGTEETQKKYKNFEKTSENILSTDSDKNHIQEIKSCSSYLGLILVCSLFLIAQLFLMLSWAFFWNKRHDDNKYKNRF